MNIYARSCLFSFCKSYAQSEGVPEIKYCLGPWIFISLQEIIAGCIINIWNTELVQMEYHLMHQV